MSGGAVACMTSTEPGRFRLEKHRWIAELVPNRTFTDVGGLFGTVNETVSLALRHGAREATMIDLQAADSEAWARFHARCRELGVTGYRSVVGDICNDRLVDETGAFDVTHCSGVIYHVPKPINLICNLISITREWLILTSMVVPERIAGSAGVLELKQGQCLLAPALSDAQRAILREYFDGRGMKVAGINRDRPFLTPAGHFRYGPWWLVFTAETFFAMCRMFNMRVEKTCVSSYGLASVLARLRTPA